MCANLTRDSGHGTVQLMRELLILAIDLFVIFARLARPGGVRAVAAESLILGSGWIYSPIALRI